MSTAVGDVICMASEGSWIPALVKRNSKGGTVVSVSKELRRLRKIVRSSSKASSSKSQRATQKLIKRLTKDLEQQSPYCKLGPPAGSGSGLPSPTPYATLPPFITPSPTLGPTPSSGFFDQEGNVTDYGRSYLMIPSALPANIGIGKGLYNSKCTGCHIERTNRLFPDLGSQTAKEPMFYSVDSLPDTELAHITAYLNRFR